jgi:hypothetical protein
MIVHGIALSLLQRPFKGALQLRLQLQLPSTEQNLMLLLSNSQLKEELRKQSLSTNGNMAVLMMVTYHQLLPSILSRTRSNEISNVPSEKASSNQPAEVMTEQQLMQLSNAALKDILKKRFQADCICENRYNYSF